jgi:all-trans-retinol dehydrogenase (NAD+)
MGKVSGTFVLMQSKLNANLQTNRIFLPSMIANKRGHIVAIASMSGIAPTARGITYSASKCAVRGMMIALQDELEIDGLSDIIHTTTIFPWFINTRKELVENVTSKLA